jgi:FtsH-binding integral membrane protein
MHGKGVISIWFFIGALLAVYGLLIVAAGVSELMSPPASPVTLAHLHPALWWGALMLALGLVYVVKFRPGRS